MSSAERPQLTQREFDYARRVVNGELPAPRPTVDEHAATRWRDRIARDERNPEWAIRAAWSKSIKVGYEGGRARAYPPADALLVYSGDVAAPTIRTVLPLRAHLRREKVTIDSLKVCADCRQLVDPGRARGRCPWCGTSTADATPGHEIAGAVLRTFGLVPPGYGPEDPALKFVTPAAEIDVVPEPGDRPRSLRGWVRTWNGTRETSIPLDVVRALKGNHLVDKRQVDAWRTAAWPELDIQPPDPSGGVAD